MKYLAVKRMELEDDSWLNPQSEEGKVLLQTIAGSEETRLPSSAGAILNLSFYKNYGLCRFTEDLYAVPQTRYAFFSATDLEPAGREPWAMYRINERAPLNLTEETVEDYVRWLFRLWSYRRPAYIDPRTPLRWGMEVPDGQEKQLKALIHFPSYEGRDDNGNFVVRITQISWQRNYDPGVLSDALVRVSPRETSPLRPRGYTDVMVGSERALLSNLHTWKWRAF